MLANFTFRLARSHFGRRLTALVFSKMDFLIPVQRLRDTPNLLAFHHPQPSYPLHILIVPKRAAASLLDLGPRDAAFLADLVAVVQSLVRELGLEQTGYRLIANGGAAQDVQQLHFHLIYEK